MEWCICAGILENYMPRVPVLYYICISSMPHLQSCNILLTVQPYQTHEIYVAVHLCPGKIWSGIPKTNNMFAHWVPCVCSRLYMYQSGPTRINGGHQVGWHEACNILLKILPIAGCTSGMPPMFFSPEFCCFPAYQTLCYTKHTQPHWSSAWVA